MPNSEKWDVGPPMLSNVTFASVNILNIFFSSWGGGGTASHWPVAFRAGACLPLAGFWVGPSVKSPLSSGATALTF